MSKPLQQTKNSKPGTVVASTDSGGDSGVNAAAIVAVGAAGCGEGIVGGGVSVGALVLATGVVVAVVGAVSIDSCGCTFGRGFIGCGCPRNAMRAQTVI